MYITLVIINIKEQNHGKTRNFKKQEERILLAQILDKINFTKTRNKIENTDFLNMYEINTVEKFLSKINYKNYSFWGGEELSERKILIMYPENLDKSIIEKNYENILSIIRIELPQEEKGKYTHRNYLGGIMKLGIERNKIGDILVREEGADIIVIKQVTKFLLQQLPTLKRFEKSKISEHNIKELKKVELKTEYIKIIVPSLRLDNFVSDLAKTSRNKATELIKEERIFVNGQCETKVSKKINIGDTITIRGKGRFVVKEHAGTTRNNRDIIIIEKFI